MKKIPTPYFNLKFVLFTIIFVLICAGFFWIPPMPQPLSYHNFADVRTYLAIPNAFNVLSNLIFFSAGVSGCYVVIKNPQQFFYPFERVIYFTLFVGSILITFGSGYYHLDPNNTTLMWDRLPMTIVFMSLFTAMVGERIGPPLAKRIFVPLLLFGFSSVIYWHFTDDLRWYALVQFGPILIFIFMMIFYRSCYTNKTFLYLALIFYLLAKIFEMADHQTFYLTHQLLSGHTIKHFLSGLSIYALAVYIMTRCLVL